MLDTFSDETSSVTLYSKNTLAILDFHNVRKNATCNVKVIKIPHIEIENMFWIHPTEYVFQDTKGKLCHLVENQNNFSLFQWEDHSLNKKIINLSRKFSKSPTEQICIGTSTNKSLFLLSFSDHQISLYQAKQENNFQQTFFATKTKQYISLESTCMHVVHPTRKTIRTIPLHSKDPIQAIEFENGNLVILHKNKFNLFDIDMEKLVKRSTLSTHS